MNLKKKKLTANRFFTAVWALAALVVVSCSKHDTVTQPDAGTTGKYANGFFVINEGWYGHETGSVYYYDGSSDSMQASVYAAENPDTTLGKASSTLEYATIFNNKLYLVVKVGGPLVVTDANTLKESARLTALPDNDGRSFVGVNDNLGLLGTSKGVYLLGLSPLSAGTRLDGVSGAMGDMVKAGDYVFAASQTYGLAVINTTTFAVTKTIANVRMGPVTGYDGNVWVTGDSVLVRINKETLAADTVKLPIRTYSAWSAWHSTSMAASTSENAVFFIQNGSFSGGTNVYKYISGNPNSVAVPFITLPDGQYSYGAGIGYNKTNNELIITTLNGAYTGNVNRVLIYDAATAVLKKTLTYNGYYFPAMPVFH